jgi:alpha-mannosidase
MKRSGLLCLTRTLAPFLLLFTPLLSAGQTNIQILKLEPTVLFPKAMPLHQLALLEVLNSGASLRCKIQVKVASSEPELGPVAVIPAGYSTLRVPIPDIASPQQVSLAIRPEQGGQLLASVTQDWIPQRKWKVYVVVSSHEDRGYEDYIYKKQSQIADYIDIAQRLSAVKANEYHYTLETMIFMRSYMEDRSESQWRDLIDQHIKTGQMDLMGAPSGVHTHWMDYEELARMTYPARREVLDRFGLNIKTFMEVDNPSLSWSSAEVLAGAGFQYAARWGQEWRSGGNNDYEHTKLPALFWWLAPDGVHKVLFAWRSHYGLSFWYGQQESGYRPHLFDLGSENVNHELKSIENGTTLGPYPYDAVVYPSYSDHAIPHIAVGALSAWNKEYSYPEIQIRSPTDFFGYMEGKYAKELPVLSGDLNNFSGDYATIDPESQGWKRQASRGLPVAEGLSAIDSYLDRSYQPTGAQAAKIWTQIFDYDEHSWPTQPLASDLQLFNSNWDKKQAAERALRDTTTFLDAGMKSLASQVRSDGNRLIVFNSLAQQRDDIVNFAGDCASVEDLSTGKVEPCEQDGAGRSVFIARGVPAYGYKVYRYSRQTAAASAKISTSADSIANQFYKIQFDRSTGNVVSILDKTTGRELVDPKAKYQFNQMVYVHKNTALSKDGFEYSPARARETKSRQGPVSVSFDSWTDDPKTGAAIHQTITLYDGLPQIDIVNNLQHAQIMFSKNYVDRYRENIFYAFPLAVPGGQPRAEYAGGVVRPHLDQLSWGSQDYLTANRWVDVSNDNFGVTLAPWNEATVDFGEIRYNQLSINYTPTKSYLFSYAWSNRMAGLLTLNADDCKATLHYSLRSHAGNWNAGETTRFGWAIASPLIAFITGPNPNGSLDAKQSSFFSVDAPNVQMTVLKQSEQPGKGWIVRLVETEGKPTEAEIKSGLLPITDAYESDLAENDIKKLDVSQRTIKARVLPFGFLTLRLVNGSAPARVENLTATAMSGEKVALQWNSAGANDRYAVFRSDDPQDPATEYTLLGTVTAPEFHDDGLDPGTTYYYQVVAVSQDNIGGAGSAPAKVTTQAAALEPPAAVKGLNVIRLSPTRLVVCWRKSPEKNAARYYIYRSDQAQFDPKRMSPLAVVAKNGYFLETYTDPELQPSHQYYYKVLPENWSGERQPDSIVATGVTPHE